MLYSFVKELWFDEGEGDPSLLYFSRLIWSDLDLPIYRPAYARKPFE